MPKLIGQAVLIIHFLCDYFGPGWLRNKQAASDYSRQEYNKKGTVGLMN